MERDHHCQTRQRVEIRFCSIHTISQQAGENAYSYRMLPDIGQYAPFGFLRR